MKEEIRVLVVDDLELIIEGIEALLSQSPRIRIVGSACNGIEAIDKVIELKPDVVLMDISMPEMDGIEATRAIKAKVPNTKVLILTMYDMFDVVNDALLSGVDGFLLKNTSRVELIEAVERIVEGELYLSEKVKEELELQKIAQPDLKKSRPLSKREKEIVKLVLCEMTTQEIAKSLFLSPATVETHRRNILDKLQVRNTAGLVKYAVERGW